MALSSEIKPFTVNMQLVGARLCNFGTGSAELQASHRSWIDSHLAPTLKRHPGCWVDLIGYASRSGNAAANLELSKKRIAAVEAYLRSRHPTLKFNMRIPKGEEDSAADKDPDDSNDGYWRAVLIRWYGVQSRVPTPVYPPPELKFRTYRAPKGCWLILAVNTFGLPVKQGVDAGTAVVSLLNDRGELWKITGAGAGASKSLINLEFDKWIKDAAASLVSNLGNLANIPGMPDLPSAPGQTAGPVLKHLSWAANLEISDITRDGWFTIASAEAHAVALGTEGGLIVFGNPLLRPWGFFTSVGMATLRVTLGASCLRYKILSVVKHRDQFRGWSDLS